MMKRVAELDHEPVVGKRYSVPCVKNKRGLWMPVIGPKHHDIEFIGLSNIHYHYDFRFIKQDFIVERMNWFAFNRRIACTPESFAMAGVLSNTDEPTRKALICLRRMPVFPLSPVGVPLFWMEPMEAAYRDAKVNCSRCPHRGLPLDQLPQDAEGNVVCAGHGLKWNLATGKLVSRLV